MSAASSAINRATTPSSPVQTTAAVQRRTEKAPINFDTSTYEGPRSVTKILTPAVRGSAAAAKPAYGEGSPFADLRPEVITQLGFPDNVNDVPHLIRRILPGNSDNSGNMGPLQAMRFFYNVGTPWHKVPLATVVVATIGPQTGGSLFRIDMKNLADAIHPNNPKNPLSGGRTGIFGPEGWVDETKYAAFVRDYAKDGVFPGARLEELVKDIQGQRGSKAEFGVLQNLAKNAGWQNGDVPETMFRDLYNGTLFAKLIKLGNGEYRPDA